MLVRERWQIELLFKLWKPYGCLDEWRTSHPWRILCEVDAKLMGLLLQHWRFLLFARAAIPKGVSSNSPTSYARQLP